MFQGKGREAVRNSSQAKKQKECISLDLAFSFWKMHGKILGVGKCTVKS